MKCPPHAEAIKKNWFTVQILLAWTKGGLGTQGKHTTNVVMTLKHDLKQKNFQNESHTVLLHLPKRTFILVHQKVELYK